MRAEQVQKPPSVTTLSAGTDKWKERNHLEGRAECDKHDRTCVWKKHSWSEKAPDVSYNPALSAN